MSCRLPKSLLLLLLLFAPLFMLEAQTSSSSSTKKMIPPPVKPLHDYPLYNGVLIGVDLFSPVTMLFGQKYGEYTLQAEVNLLNRFFPTWEIGVGLADYRPEEGNFTYISRPALFNRVGMNYRFKYNSLSPNYVYIGVRYGFSAFSYELKDVDISAPYWGTQTRTDIPSQSAVTHWLEAGAGLRVKVYKRFYMGFEVRYKFLFSEGNHAMGNPGYIPGFGTREMPIGFYYTIYFKL